MLRFWVGAATALGVVAAIGGCSSDVASIKLREAGPDEGRQGSIGLNLQPVSGVTIDVVRYTVTQGNATDAVVIKTGNLPVPGTGQDFSFGVPLPKGSGYYLNLAADSSDGDVTCAGGFGPFDVAANASVQVTPTLRCIDVTTGQTLVSVDVATTACPDITFDYVVATSKAAYPAMTIRLLSNAASGSGKMLTYNWTTAYFIGTIVPSTSKDATLTCDHGAGARLTVTASNGECSKSVSTKVTCADPTCGNGWLDPGETCDKALDLSCPADCTQVCGDDVVEGTEQCEPRNTPTCGPTCQSRGWCGDGFILGAEECDLSATPSVPPGTPLGTTCSVSCFLVGPRVCVCGDGVTCSPGETCDPPFGTNNNCGGSTPNSAPGATGACQLIETPACMSCVASAGLDSFDCATLTGNATGGPSAGESLKSLCYKVLDCIYDTNCAEGDTVDCYCGTSGDACQTGAANGKCRAQIEAALESTAFGEISARIGDPAWAGGTAIVRVDGSKPSCRHICGTL